MLNALAASSAQPVTQAALKMMLYTGLRDAALRGARWQEIDYGAAVWTVPPERMKGRKDRRKAHAVPLPRQAIAVLKQLQRLTDRGPESFIFPGPGKAGCLSENTLCKVLRTLGFDVTAHGLRSLITDALYEAGFRSEAIERQFAHADRNEVRAAYLSPISSTIGTA
jgi:integrase